MSLSVAHVLAPAAFGGLESVVLTLARGQARSGATVTVIATFTESPESQPFWRDLVEVPGVRAVPLVLGARQYGAEIRGIRDMIREVEADVMHTHGYRPDLLAAPIAWRRPVGTVTTVHGFTGNGWKNRAYEWMQRRAYRGFDAVVAVSRKLAGELKACGVPPAALHCVPNAWDPVAPPLGRGEARDALGLPLDGASVGWVGRMTPEKGPDVALEAFGALSNSDAGLSMVGEGRMRPTLMELADEKGWADRVRWHGVVPGAGRLLKAFDALIISSWTEGTPIVLLEAMAAGVPVVSTAVGGIPDVVSDAEAILVEPGDTEGLAAALESILAGAPDAARRAEAARTRLQRELAVEPWVRRYDEIYRSCLKG